MLVNVVMVRQANAMAQPIVRCLKRGCEGLAVAFITDNPGEIF